jgi:hypothetical protein
MASSFLLDYLNTTIVVVYCQLKRNSPGMGAVPMAGGYFPWLSTSLPANQLQIFLLNSRLGGVPSRIA